MAEQVSPIQLDRMAKLSGVITAALFVLLFFYAFSLPYWLGVPEEDLPAAKAIHELTMGSGLPILLWCLILFVGLGMTTYGVVFAAWCFFHLVRRLLRALAEFGE